MWRKPVHASVPRATRVLWIDPAVTTFRKLNAHRWEREPHEHYVEEHWCSRRLFETEPIEGMVWDPACGWGRICDSAIATGHTIFYSDIVDRGYDPHGSKIVRDFLKPNWPVVDNIVTNPPFDLFEQFAHHALTLTRRKVAMIWLVRRLNAAHWLEQTPLRRIYLMTPRPSMPPGHVIARGERPGGGTQDFCWLVWEHGFGGSAEVGWLQRVAGQATDRKLRRNNSMADIHSPAPER
jgi:hypothetical protein